ncbi:hypothetical protein EDB86DRAFT_3075441 [Lactarius hatsudake]|nr:hypothetical protein EDB86DRAFT_3075441 [Lactarius hatsudake]
MLIDLAKKIQFVNWVFTKLDIPIIIPDGDALTFDQHHLGRGHRDRAPDNASGGTSGGLSEFNQAALSQLEAMGFPLV